MYPFGSTPQTPSFVRRLLERELPSDAQFDAFVLDYFPAIYRRFSTGMDRLAKENLLLSLAGHNAVLTTLRHPGPLCSGTDSSTVEFALESPPRPKRPVVWLLVAIGLGSFILMFPWYERIRRSNARLLPSPPPGMVCLSGGPIVIQTEEGTRRYEVSPFCIDVTLVTQARYLECVRHGNCSKATSTNYFDNDDRNFSDLYSSLCTARFPDLRGNHPINCIDQQQAAAFCQYDGNKRLPTEAEWMIAAGGQLGWPYPWGPEPPTPERLNACDARCVDWASKHGLRFKIQDGSKSNIIAVEHDGVPSERLFEGDDGWETTSEVRSKPPNLYGLFDMAGNLRQFTSDKVTRCKNGKCGEWPVLKGGSWSELRPAHVGISWRTPSPPTLRAEIYGFRCVINR